MEWHQIQYFQMVAETEHFTRAAEILSISQPALSRAISKLEEELGVQLFDRTGRNIVLNKYGKMFLQRVERSIQEIELGKQEIHDMIHPDHGTISLSFLHSLGISFIPGILKGFLNKYPEVKFHLSQAGSLQVFEKLLTGECDIALLSYLQDDNELHWESLWSEELFLIVSANHPLAEIEEINLISIRDEPFIAFKNGYGLRTIVDKLCSEAGFTPKVAFEGEEIGTVAGLVEAQLGVSIVPDVKVLDKNKIKLIRLKNPVCMREIGLTWKKGRYLSPVTERFIVFVKSLSQVQKF
ncbi:LysR family transcriptional regulator [Heyndrickxia shackletonii]|uniref:LysR family transcriptional regulator n=1 Tax=Heyndrickxia shackletonii TaxID=157838 RepID=A0A0Q3WYZ4_9BACI|nr:LysR family transcriptional regulator [Heyndrickxia shackletonii]KQL54316.1 LysR family transcriptional regulator [Heyndrickxia shackletonii]NEZ01201.1 LysR family transcriptional regulator [Heyndrickxia shackletonii]